MMSHRNHHLPPPLSHHGPPLDVLCPSFTCWPTPLGAFMPGKTLAGANQHPRVWILWSIKIFMIMKIMYTIFWWPVMECWDSFIDILTIDNSQAAAYIERRLLLLAPSPPWTPFPTGGMWSPHHLDFSNSFSNWWNRHKVTTTFTRLKLFAFANNI